MLPLHPPQLPHGVSGAPYLEIGGTYAPRVERPLLLQLPHLVQKVLLLRNEHAMPAHAHTI